MICEHGYDLKNEGCIYCKKEPKVSKSAPAPGLDGQFELACKLLGINCPLETHTEIEFEECTIKCQPKQKGTMWRCWKRYIEETAD
jgi:hypothetical protein